METRNDDAGRSKVLDLVSDIKFAQLVTQDSAGKLRSRPMVAAQKPTASELWFFTSASSPKIDDIEHHPEVLLNYSDPSGQSYVAIHGEAEIVRDRERIRRMWSEPVRVWFPKGADDPDLVLIRVAVTEAEYWDSPSSMFTQVYGYAKAVSTGEPPKVGEAGHVDFGTSRH